MQQTLIRILLTDWFTIDVREGIRFVGVGFLIIPWSFLGIYELYASHKAGKTRKEQVASLSTWGFVALAILALPLIAGNLPIESVPVFGWGFMIVVGFLAAITLTSPRAKKIGLPTEIVWDLCTQLLFAGIIGSRVFYLIQYRERVFKNAKGFDAIKAALNFSDGGMVFYGGVILGILAYIRFCKKRNIPALVLADLMVPALLLGLAFGRIGCFLNGCCFGGLCEQPWAVTFPPGSPPYLTMLKEGAIPEGAAESLPIHPTQIYSSLNAFVLCALTVWWFKKRKRDGEVLVVALLCYPVTRFVLEIVRNDEEGQLGLGLTISQLVSIGMFSFGLILLKTLTARKSLLTPLPLKLSTDTSETEFKEAAK